MESRPQNIGIKAIEIYFPSQCVDQAELEKFNGVSTGKYTIGLGQTKMSFCDDREDIYSLALTTVSSLLRKYSIDPKSIGRLEVGTESMLDKSKSVKSVLMQLFTPSGNTNIEGVDTVNACYGGTNALFNSINWVESSAWDGRDAIVCAGDIALYEKGPARPTGGAGCVAMLIGPNAPLAFEPGLRGTYMQHAYDFYKANLSTEFPLLDGMHSINCYTQAVDACYNAYNEREALVKKRQTNGIHNADETTTPLDRFDFMVFHAPNCKLVAKSYARLLYNDFLNEPLLAAFKTAPSELRDISLEESYIDKRVEKTFMGLSKKNYEQRVKPGIEVPTMCGNMYCASIFSGLVSLLSNVKSEQLQGRRVGLFSYGSGLASSFFSLQIKGDVSDIVKKLDIHQRMEARRTVSPEVYDEICMLRQNAYGKRDYKPKGNPETITKGTYYLIEVDDRFKREYKVKA